MTKRSTMLKVVSILMIIIGAIALIVSLLGVVGTNMAAGYIPEIEGELTPEMVAAGLDANALLSAMMIASVIGMIGSGFEMFCGIFGLASKSKKAIQILGIIVIVLEVVSLIMTITSGGFTVWSLVSFILPILYFIGAKMCIQ